MSGDIAEATEASLRVLAGETNPFAAVYARSTLLVRPIRIRDRLDAGGIRRPMEALILHVVDADWLCLRLAQRADFYVVRDSGLKAVDPPERLCRVVLAAAPWPGLPTLTGIIEAPTILPTGRVIQTPGYDATTGLLFDPGDMRFPLVPTKPSRQQAEAALRTLAEPFKDFPFIDEASSSVALAAVLTALVRRRLRAAPLFAYDAPKMASGKTLLITVVSYIATGRGPYLLSQVTDPTDERKRLLATLLEGPAVVVIDNVEHPLKSDALCTALTEPSFTDRLLGVSKTATAATNVTFAATGNNLVIAGDLSARSLLCRLDPGVERPEEREFARDLHTWVPAHRAELAVAASTIIAAYLTAGAPKLPVKNFARFEDWQRLCRFPLIWLGLADPCATRDNIEASDPEREKLRVLLIAWHDDFGERIVTIKEVISAATANAASLRDAIDMAVPAEKGGVFSGLKLAKFVGRFVRRIEGGLRFERAADDSHHKVACWSVKRVESAGDAGVCGCSSSPYAREQKTEESPCSKNDSGTGWKNPRKHPQPPQDAPSEEAVFAPIAAAATAGATFRLSGNRVEINGLEKVEQAELAVAAFLREHDRAVFAALGGGAADQPSLALIETLGVEIAYCADDSTAAAAIVEVLAEGGDRLIAIDVETAALAEYADYPPMRLTIAGRPNKVQPRADNPAAPDPHCSAIRLVQLYGGGKRAAVLDMRSVSWAVLAPLWERPLVAHNAGFELKFLAALGIKPRLQCTEQAVKLLSGVPQGGVWGLADACQTYLGIAVPKELQISDWATTELSPGQLAYAAADAVLCWRLWAKIAPQLKVTNRDAAYRLQRHSLPVAAAMELRGIGIDLDAHATLCDSWRASREAAASAWSESMGRPLPEKPSDIAAYLTEVLDEKALSNWPRTKTGLLSTKTAQLEKVRHLPGIAPLLRIKEIDKLLQAFGEPLRKLVSPMTGRLHPHFKVAAAKTGRWSANGPNIQQLPHDKATRSIIVAAPGHVLVSADYSQMELRAAACISGDPELTRVYEQGLDVHRLTAAAIAGVPVEEVTKEQRTAAKAANFGLIYGSGPAGLVASAWANYGVQLTEEEAAVIRDRFFGKYRILGQWMRHHADRCQSEGRIVIGAGRVIEATWEPFGIRYTLACNAPIQGACADCTMRAVIAVHQRMPGILVAQIHDELLVEVPEDMAEQASAVMVECMTEAFIETFPGAPLLGIADVKVGKSWAEVH